MDYRVRRIGDTDWRPIKQRVPITWTPCHFGGKRPWFLCPCGRRAAKLYGAGDLFTCRRCSRLVYASEQQVRRWRLLSKAQKIRVAFGGSGSILEPFPPKPTRMRWRTYERLRHRSETTMLSSLGITAEHWRRQYGGKL